MKYWIKERHNGQTSPYFVACGKLSKAAAKRMEKSLAGYNIMRAFDTEAEYQAHIEYLKENGERVQ